MPGSNKYKLLSLGLLVVLLAAGVVLISNAPHERTLGPGILPVYVHVSLTWTGMLFFILSAGLGVLEAILSRKVLFNWLRPLFMSAYITYLAGFLVSLWASYINWNGIPFREPRIVSALSLAAAASLCAVMLYWLPSERLAGVLAAIPAIMILSGLQNVNLVLHPDNPIRQAPDSIRHTFMAMFGLALLLGVWLVWVQRLFFPGKSIN